MNDNKIQKEVKNLKRVLIQERNLKLDAFQKVDELQSHLYDLEDEITNVPTRPQTCGIPNSPSVDAKVTTKLIKRSTSSNSMQSLEYSFFLNN